MALDAPRATGSRWWTRGPRCCRSIRSARRRICRCCIGGGALVAGVLARVRELRSRAVRANRRRVAGRARRGARGGGTAVLVRPRAYGGGHSSGDGGGAGPRPAGAGVSGARRAVRRPGRSSAGRGHEHAAAAAGRRPRPRLHQGRRAHRRGHRRRRGTRAAGSSASGWSGAPASAGAWSATSRRPPAPSTRR